MPLHNKAVIEIDAFDRTGVFEFREHEPNRELTHDYLVGGRGQILTELYAQASDIAPNDILPDSALTRRAGYYLDAGAGANRFPFTARVGRGDEDLRWGDGSSASGSANKYDAEGEVAPSTKRDVLTRWLAKARTDSGGQMRLYFGEWSDGTHASTPGVYGEPKTVVLISLRTDVPTDEPSTVQYTFEMEETTPVPDGVNETIDDFSDAASNAVDELGDIVSDT
jgi:hypothetical protein